MTSNNAYRVDLRDHMFLLWQQFKVQDNILDSEIYPEFDQNLSNQLIEHAHKFCCQKLGPLYQSSDRDGCKLMPDGKVQLPQGFEALWDDYISAQWGRLGAPEQYGGLGAPYIIAQAIYEIFMGANPAFMIYSGFCSPALYLIDKFGTQQLKDIFCKKLATNEWGACLCMTEPDAGSDVGNCRTKAIKQSDGRYQITGQKIFISAGMHQLTDNIAYIVLARVEGARSGTVGLSCFVVPKQDLENQDNGVKCLRLENKMGLNGCATSHLTFGTDTPCYGYLLGERENIGLRQLISMMNLARIATGMYALGMASSAYLNAAEYASQRIQGTDFKQSFNPKAERVSIITHVDVKRMLLEMKSKVEGCRALIVKLCYHQSMTTNIMVKQETNRITTEQSETLLYQHQSLVNLLTPIVKAYTSDQAWRVAELAIQVYGGHGYIKDHPVEQYARDIKVLSLWEGTNFVQSADLFKDKLAMGRHSKLLALYEKNVMTFIEKNRQNSTFEKSINMLEKSLTSLTKTHQLMGSWIRLQKMELIFAVSTRFLQMMAEVTVAWLLLDGAIIANKAMDGDIDQKESEFYQGKITSANFYINNILPNVFSAENIIALADENAVNADHTTFLPS
jgi:acyl-CoA dehydrogenase|tara:strand:- start:54 stop:1913 length:1860 start_codon:yes stop_codon:yes gene_type:complete